MHICQYLFVISGIDLVKMKTNGDFIKHSHSCMDKCKLYISFPLLLHIETNSQPNNLHAFLAKYMKASRECGVGLIPEFIPVIYA